MKKIIEKHYSKNKTLNRKSLYSTIKNITEGKEKLKNISNKKELTFSLTNSLIGPSITYKDFICEFSDRNKTLKIKFNDGNFIEYYIK